MTITVNNAFNDGHEYAIKVVICTGNPYFQAYPYPYLLITHTHFTGTGKVTGSLNKTLGSIRTRTRCGLPGGFVITNAKKMFLK